jgi:hypothetical protein
MCFGGSTRKQDAIAAASAAEARAEQERMRAEEAQRRERITMGQGRIDEAFGKYNDDYFKGFQNSYTGFYEPEIGRQENEARDALTARLAGQGLLESSVSASKLADLARKANEARTRIGGEAVDQANALRGRVEQSKTNLYSVNNSSADPNAISARATGEATSLAAPQSFQPLGNLFTDLISSIGTAASANANSPASFFSGNKGGGFATAPTSGAGSSSVVR